MKLEQKYINFIQENLFENVVSKISTETCSYLKVSGSKI